MGAKWKIPPEEKIPEAYSAVSSGRVTFPEEGMAQVLSSDGKKAYHVRWDAGGYDSDDNGSRWQGYAGYPIVAVLILQKRLPADPEIMKLFSGIDWTERNKKFKRDYAASLQSVLDSFPPDTDQNAVRQAIRETYEALKALAPERRDRKKDPEAELPAAVPFPEPVIVQKELMPETETAFLVRDGRYYFSMDGTEVSVLERLPENFGNLRLIGHDAKSFLLEHPEGNFVFDAMLAGYLLNPSAGDYSIAVLAEKYLRKILPADSPAAEAAALSQLRKILQDELVRTEAAEIFRTMEMPLVPVLAGMERVGIRYDAAVLPGYSASLASAAEEAAQTVYRTAGVTFNLNSPKQLGEILFVKLALPAGKKTKSGYSTDSDVLESLRDKHPCIEPLIRYRKITKLLSTYADVLPGLVREDGRIHSTFHMTSTATGRLSSVAPNLQNIPVRSELGGEIRKMFLPAPGMRFISADYSQIELRLLAHISGDPVMQAAFRNGEDIHRITAAGVFGISPSEVTDEQRRRAKAVNFGIIYGISAFALARDLGISRKEAADCIDGYLKRYEGAARYLKRSVEEAREKGYARTIFGRRRYLPELSAPNAVVRAFGERAALNAPIQGSSADIIKLAMIRTDGMLKESFPETKIVLQIHDELILECPEEDVPSVSEKLKDIMEHVTELEVPLTVDVTSGPDWYSL